MNPETERAWKSVLQKLRIMFGEDVDLQSILFLIGVQELGKGYRQFSKSEKIDVMHIAICTLLENYGYYKYEGRDEEGWPHWKLNETLPPLEAELQLELMKQAIIDYFKKDQLSMNKSLSEIFK